jgi:hypothetical protein
MLILILPESEAERFNRWVIFSHLDERFTRVVPQNKRLLSG